MLYHCVKQSSKTLRSSVNEVSDSIARAIWHLQELLLHRVDWQILGFFFQGSLLLIWKAKTYIMEVFYLNGMFATTVRSCNSKLTLTLDISFTEENRKTV